MFARKLSIKESTPLKKPTAILQTKFLSRGMSSAMKSERQQKLSLLAGKLSIEKKVCGFELCLQLSKRYTSLLARKILHCAVSFLPSKVTYIFCITLDPVQIRRIFFFLGNPPYAKKSKRDSLYFDLSLGPFHSAKFLCFRLF